MNIKLWEEINLIELQNLLESSGKNAAKGTISKTERKLIVKHWRDTIPKNASGIYQIKNKINGRYYVGSAKNLRKRFGNHLGDLICGNHGNGKLQNDWNKYGGKNYEFSVLEFCLPEDRFVIEQKYLDVGFLNPKLFFNINLIALSGEIRKFPTESERRESVRKRNNTRYNFYNILTKESLFLSTFELKDKYPVLDRNQLVGLIRGDLDSHQYWTLMHNAEKVSNLTTTQGKTTAARIKTREEIKSPIIYHFINLKTKEEFVGYKFELINKYRCKDFAVEIDRLVNKKKIFAKYWVLKERLEEVLSGKTTLSKRLLTILNKEVDPPIYELLNVATDEVFKGTELEFRKISDNKNKQLIKCFMDDKTFRHGFWIKKENYQKFLNQSERSFKILFSKMNKLKLDQITSQDRPPNAFI